MLIQLLIVIKTVRSRHSLIIIAQRQECTWRGAVNLQVVTKLKFQLLILLQRFLILGRLT